MSKVKQISVKPNQTLFDIALKEHGSIESVFDVLDNNTQLQNLNSTINVSQELNINSKAIPVKEVIDYYDSRNIEPASQEISAHIVTNPPVEPPVIKRLYIRPLQTGQTNVYHIYDDGWKVANNADTYIPLSEGIPMFLQKNNIYKTIPDNIFNHKHRWTGKNGGYWDNTLNNWYDVNGVITTQVLATTFQLIVLKHHQYLIGVV